jgi:hypothetical protein
MQLKASQHQEFATLSQKATPDRDREPQALVTLGCLADQCVPLRPTQLAAPVHYPDSET